MLLDFAKESDIPALKSIWKQVFRDTDSYIDGYFDKTYHLIRIPVVRNAYGAPVSMLSMFPVRLKQKGLRLQGHYIYGAATLPEAEGQGMMTKLLEFSCEQAAKWGDVFSCLVPASDFLFRFYGKRGYETVFYRSWYHFPPYRAAQPQDTVRFSPLSPDDFIRRRRAFTEGMPSVLLPSEPLYPYLYQELITDNAEILSVSTRNGNDYLVCENTDILTVKETSVPAESLESVVAALKAYFGRDEVIAILPAVNSGGSRKPYGMLRSLAAMPKQKESFPYMGLMMD